MRRKFLALAMGIAAAMMAGGCSGKAAETAEQTVQAESGTGQPQNSMPDSEKESYYAQEASGDEEAEDAPLRVVGTITEVGEETLLVDASSQEGCVGEVMLMIDPENTLVLDGANGYPVELKEVEAGGFEAYLGPAMTMSLPPQTTPYVVIVNIPEGEDAPQYVIASTKVDEVKGKNTLVGVDEAEYPLARSVDVKPYLTRNVVRLEDIESGSRCLVWRNGEGEVDRIVLFGE